MFNEHRMQGRGSKKNFNCAIGIFRVRKFVHRFCSCCLSKICTTKDGHEEEGEQLWTDFCKLQTSDSRRPYCCTTCPTLLEPEVNVDLCIHPHMQFLVFLGSDLDSVFFSRFWNFNFIFQSFCKWFTGRWVGRREILCYCCCSLLACMHACIFFRGKSWAYGSRDHWGLARFLNFVWKVQGSSLSSWEKWEGWSIWLLGSVQSTVQPCMNKEK